MRSLLLLALFVAGPAELLARFANGVKLEGPFRPAARTCIFHAAKVWPELAVKALLK